MNSEVPQPSPSKAELEKAASRYLRGTLKEQLALDTTHFEGVSNTLKFHGIYEQDDRDARPKLLKEGQARRYIFMIRTKIPGGRLTWQQYLALDALADQHANHTLRITTRQGIQLHGVIKRDLKATLRAMNDGLVTTLGACGDIERNVVTCPAPLPDRARAQIQEYAKRISDDLLPKTRAYHEIWLNGEQVTADQPETEPLYGKTYLPRKFKTTIAFPGDNCVDVYAQDIGLVAQLDGQGELTGFNILVGGGLGMTHRRPETHPILAKPLGYVSKDQVIQVIEAVVTVQRDHGNRQNRMRARMKYLIEERGIEWFAQQVRQHTSVDLEPIREMRWDRTEDHLGWHQMGNGRMFYGIFVENGRIKDEGAVRMKTGLRKMVERYHAEVRLTPQQNLLIAGIEPTRRSEVEGLMREYGMRREAEISNTERWSMACPALPTCGLAITEGERAMPGLIDRLEQEVARLGLQDERITIRLTGCPNGCARPYTAEIGLVGITQNTYTLLVGGNFEETRLAQPLLEMVPADRIVPTIAALLGAFKAGRAPGERFGDFCHRIGLAPLKEKIGDGSNLR